MGERSAHGAPSLVKQVNNNASSSFTLFPNPNFGNFTVKAMAVGTFTVHTLLGQRIADFAITAGRTSLALPASMADGVYTAMFRFANGDGGSECKIVYQR